MKQLLAILIIVTITNPAFSQANSSLLFKGKWISEAFEDPIRLNFLDEQNGIINWETWSKTESRFIYKTTIRNGEVTLTLHSADKTRTDSLKIIMLRINSNEYKIKNIIHEYMDGRPPEWELLENVTYFLRKE